MKRGLKSILLAIAAILFVSIFVAFWLILLPFRKLAQWLGPAHPKLKHEEIVEKYNEQLHEIYKSREHWERACHDLPIWVRRLYAVDTASLFICTEGLKDYLLDDLGSLAPEARDGFQELGLSQAAAAIQTGIDLFGKTFPPEQKARHEVFHRGGFAEESRDQLDEAERLFREALGMKNIGRFPPTILRERIENYVRQHLGEFPQ